MATYSYKSKNDFDDMHIKHQTKSQFKNKKSNFTDISRHNSKRSSFIDCFTNDSIINPTINCPPGANCVKNKSSFENDFHCPSGFEYDTHLNQCIQTNKKPLSYSQMLIQQNRKSGFFNSIVE